MLCSLQSYDLSVNIATRHFRQVFGRPWLIWNYGYYSYLATMAIMAFTANYAIQSIGIAALRSRLLYSAERHPRYWSR